LTLIIICGAVLYMIFMARRGVKLEVRRIPGIDVIDEAIGRATEMGKPVHITNGLATLYSAASPQTIAGLSVLSYSAKQCAKNGTPLITTIYVPETIPLIMEIYREASVMAGAPEWFNEYNIRYMSSERFSYATGVQGVLQREKPAASLLMGNFMAEALVFAESGYLAGAIQVAGTAATSQIPFFVAVCDYTLLGDELYAAGAYLSGDSTQIASIAGQDIGKYWAIVLLLVGLILSAIGNKWLVDMLKM
jgi:hypothetical protein